MNIDISNVAYYILYSPIFRILSRLKISPEKKGARERVFFHEPRLIIDPTKRTVPHIANGKINTKTNRSSSWQLPFPGLNVHDIFNAILNEDVFYPLSISLEAYEILQGVRK